MENQDRVFGGGREKSRRTDPVDGTAWRCLEQASDASCPGYSISNRPSVWFHHKSPATSNQNVSRRKGQDTSIIITWTNGEKTWMDGFGVTDMGASEHIRVRPDPVAQGFAGTEYSVTAAETESERRKAKNPICEGVHTGHIHRQNEVTNRLMGSMSDTQ